MLEKIIQKIHEVFYAHFNHATPGTPFHYVVTQARDELVREAEKMFSKEEPTPSTDLAE